jgi:hypothetical protein
MNRRRLIQGGAAALALSALGLGGFVQWRRGQGARMSEPITESWPELGQGIFWLKPNLDGARMVVPDRPHSKEESRLGNFGRTRTFYVSTNGLRLRNGPLGPKTGTRILCMGDSVTFGWGVPDDMSYPAQLERELKARGHQVEVLNAGVPAQSIFGMKRFVETQAAAMEVDAVLWTRRPQLNLPSPVGDYVRELQHAQKALPNAKFGVVLTPVSRFDPYGVANYANEEKELRRKLTLPMVELSPIFFRAQTKGVVCEGLDELTMKHWDGTIIEQGTRPEHDLPPSFYAAFEDDHDLKEHLFFDSGHPDAEGFTLFAKTVADLVEDNGWLG